MQSHPRHLGDADLIRAIEHALPLPVFLTKRAGDLRGEDGRRLAKTGQKLLATGVLDGESIAGISLVIPLDKGKHALAISLTAVRVEPRHPLYKEIKAYQLDRIARLAAERLRETADRRSVSHSAPRLTARIATSNQP
jgi:hypothetical protein